MMSNKTTVNNALSMVNIGKQVSKMSKRIKELEKALKPFAHDDLTKMLGGCSEVLGDENIIFQRNSAVLKLKHFKQAKKLLEGVK